MAADGPLSYPSTKRTDVVDVLHGVKVADPYRWLEDDVRKSKDVADWVEAQNKVTFGYLKAIPERDAIVKRLTELWNYERYSAPFKTGGRYFYTRNDGLQNQSVLYTLDSLDGEPRVLIDPNTWSKDGTVALGNISVSEDGKYVAYSVAEAGSDWNTWRVLDFASGKQLGDEVRWVKFSGTPWTKDSKGFFYSRYDEPQAGAQFQSLNLNQKVYYHRIGTPQTDDVLVYKRPDHPDWGFSTEVTEDGHYLIITIWKGTDSKYRVTFKDLNEPLGLPVDLIENFDNEYSFIGNEGPVFYFKTDLDAPRGRIIAIDTRKPEKANWKEIIPQAQEVLRGIGLVGNLFITSYLKDARTQVKLWTMEGKFVREVEFPTLGSAGGWTGKRTDTVTFYSFSSFATPPSIYRYDVVTGQSKLIRQAKVKFTPEEYEVKQVFYKSKDGTQVPMFLTHKKGIKLDGSNPTLLYGYGGFNIPLPPAFAVSRVAWVEMGGVFAQANLRGGGEYGKDWHKAGTKLQKQNVFDDFIAAAEWLVSNKYTAPARLGIQGGSNGGLLVGACMTQRPDLFGACLPAVGVMDMLRFQKFTAGRFWVDDYGSADNADEFKALFAYSPYHNLKKGTKYPPTLVTTADTDDRVVPGHSFKFIAQLQYAQAGPSPVLARIETKAGHGAGKPTAKLIEEVADQWAFLVKNLGVKLAGNGK
ncbi:prolyl endopeptidase [Planctomycetaceae bacterium SCGC AG-212-F19]|nr:prolyl endopeptidase [Planctomycetaceae bacterium SCGC AG-212-F19]